MGNVYKSLTYISENNNIVGKVRQCKSTVQKKRNMGYCLQLRDILHSEQQDVTAFCSKNYMKNGYKAGNNGHFDIVYEPGNKVLKINLPVFFKKSRRGKPFPQKKAIFFIQNIQNTWSGAHKMHTKVANRSWSSTLNDVDVNVQAVEKTDATKAYFRISYDPEMRSGRGEDYVGKQIARLSAEGFNQTQNALKGQSDINVYGHEAGHMFGLGDEYARKGVVGEKATHYNLTKKAFGKRYADRKAIRVANVKASRSIMSYDGVKVERHHYITFWDAMVQAIKAGAPDKNKAPNMREDWKII